MKEIRLFMASLKNSDQYFLFLQKYFMSGNCPASGKVKY